MAQEENDPEKTESYYREAFQAYRKAQEMYDEYEKTSGQKATAHLEAATRKLKELLDKIN